MAVIEGALSGNKAEVNADGEQLSALTNDPAKAGYTRLLDSDGNPIDTTENGFLRVSSESLIFYDQVDGNTLNTNIWQTSVSSMTVVQASGFIGLNAGQAVTAGAYAILQSIKSIPFYGSLPLIVEINAKVLNVPTANSTIELGMGVATGVSAPTDGAFFRWTPAGQFYAVVSNGGSETLTGPITGTYTDTTGETITMPPSTTVIHLYSIEVVEDHTRFYVSDTLIADIAAPAGQAFPFNAGRQTVFARVFNGGSAPSLAPQIYIGQVIVNQEDLNQQKSWEQVLTSLGRGGYQLPVAPFGLTANHTNNGAVTPGTLSNTTPPFTSLRGTFPVVAVASNLGNDYIVTSFQVPAGYQFNGNRVYVSVMVQGVAVATAAALEFYLGINSSAASLATVDGTGTWGARIEPLGVVSFPALAIVGATAELARVLDFCVDSGRFLTLIMRVLNGAATSSLVYRINFSPSGYFE